MQKIQENMHTRLDEMRKAVYRSREAKPFEGKNYPAKISLCEGGCFPRPPLAMFSSILDSLLDSSHQPLQIYPQHNTLDELMAYLENHFRTECGLSEELSGNLLLGFGSSQILEAMLSVVSKPGHIALMPTSCYHAFIDWPCKWGMTSALVETTAENQFKMTASDLDRWININLEQKDLVRIIVLANPTTAGAIYTDDELKDLAAWIAKNKIPVFMDEVYRDTEWFDHKTISLAAYPEMDKYVVTANSLSKAHFGANLRFGWAAVPTEYRIPMQKHITNSVTELPFLLQAAALGSLKGGEDLRKLFRQELGLRAELSRTYINQINLNLAEKFSPQIQIELPFFPMAGHFIPVNLDAFKGSYSSDGQLIDHPLVLAKYLQDYSEEGNPNGITLSCGYSKGHDDFTFYIAFAQLGFEMAGKEKRQTEIDYMIRHLSNHGQTEMNDTLPAIDYDATITRGRDLLQESFRRLESALMTLVLK